MLHSRIGFLIVCITLIASNVNTQSLNFNRFLDVLYSPFVNIIKHAANIDETRPLHYVTRYYCINRKNPNISEVYLNDRSLKKKINFSLPVAFLIHGWRDTTTHEWIRNIAFDWIKYQNINVCMVDWAKYSLPEYILVSNTNAQIVGNYATIFIKYLIKNGMKLETTTIVGHSLGAIIAGLIGSNLNGKIGSIYGLDPAITFFSTPQIKSRLEPTDAKFVQVIHTAIKTLGVEEKCGHQDFYPNYNSVLQPGCLFPFFGNTITKEPISCSHFKAVQYFQYALDPKNKFISMRCQDYLQYKNRSCSGVTDLLGIYSKRLAGEYFLKTTRKIPFTSPRIY